MDLYFAAAFSSNLFYYIVTKFYSSDILSKTSLNGPKWEVKLLGGRIENFLGQG